MAPTVGFHLSAAGDDCYDDDHDDYCDEYCDDYYDDYCDDDHDDYCDDDDDYAHPSAAFSAVMRTAIVWPCVRS